MQVSTILDDAGEHAEKELKTPVEIEEPEEFPPIDTLYVEKRTWKKITDVVVVSADLKGRRSSTSTSSPRPRPASTRP
jgi:hypothetical protein